MKKTKRIIPMLLIVGLLLAPAVSAQAGTTAVFSNFGFTTVPYNENYTVMATATKGAATSTWSVIFTLATGVPSSSDPPYVASGNSSTELTGLPPVNISMGTHTGTYHPGAVTKGSVCNLYVTGNSNNPYSYTMVLSGTYTP